MAKSAAEELAEIQLRIAQKQERILDAQVKSAELSLEEQEEENQKKVAERKQRKRMIAERQANFRIGRQSKLELMVRCGHLQGGPQSDPYEGGDDRQSALTVTRMPDGWTRQIYCLICHGQWWTPHPRFMQEEPFKVDSKMPAGIILEKNETANEAKERVAKYYADLAEFNELLKKAKKKLSDEAKLEGDSGTTHTNRLKRSGEQVFAWRACDTWPQVDLKAQAEEQRAA
jgi:hypothetical protein